MILEPVELMLIGAVVGALLGFALSESKKWLRLRYKAKRITKSLKRDVEARHPLVFVPPSCVWHSLGKSESIESLDELGRTWERFLTSGARVLVVTGTFGMGKTFLVRHLVANAAIGSSGIVRTPVYISSQQIRGPAVLPEVVRLLSERLGLDLEPGFVRNLLSDPSALLVFDGLDQMPYQAGAPNNLDAILDLAEAECEKERGAWLVLVVRTEFVNFVRDMGGFLNDSALWRVNVLGFQSDGQIRNAIGRLVDGDFIPHWNRYESLVRDKPSLRDLFTRPVALARYAAIPTSRLREMASTGTTIAEVFRLSFSDLDSVAHEDLQDLAFEMFTQKRYDLHLRSAQLRGNVPSLTRTKELMASTGVISVDHLLCQFTHASFRDFFVATRFVRSIRGGEPHFLGQRQNTYLVSEFTAGLLDECTLIKMLSLVNEESTTDFLINVMDILSEIEDENLKVIATEYFREEIARLAREPMTEYKTGLYTNAGIMGFDHAIDQVLRHLASVGLNSFLNNYFPTKDHFAYYEGSQERCEDEWANIVAQMKYKETRRLMATLLGEMRSVRALPTLRNVMQDSEAPLSLRTATARAVAKICGE